MRAEEMAALVLLPCEPAACRLHVRHERPVNFASTARARFGDWSMRVEDEGERKPVTEASLRGRVILVLLALLEWWFGATIRSSQLCEVRGYSLDHE